MASGARGAGDAHHDKLTAEGFEEKEHKTTTFAGTRYTQTTYKKNENQGKFARAGRVALSIAAAVPPLTVAYASKGFREDIAEAGFKGSTTRTALYDPVDPLDEERPLAGVPANEKEAKLHAQYIANRMEIADGLGDDYDSYEEYVAELGYDPASLLIQRLGYDPKNKASIRDYLKRPEIRRNLLESNGNYMLPEHRNAGRGISSFLFVPNGDFSKATSIKIHEAESGQPLKGAEFTRAMYSYSSQYEDLMKGIKEKADKWMEKVTDLTPAQKEKVKETLIKSLKNGIVVLDFKGHHTRLYPHDLDPNKYSELTGFFGSMKGTRISWSKGTTKDVDEFHKATPKKELPTHKPFEQAPPPPQADAADAD